MAQVHPRQILVIDGDPDCRELLTFLLSEAGGTVTAVQSALEAIEVLAWLQPDLILCSLAMPRMSGYDLLHHIRSLPQTALQQLPIIAITATAEQFGRQRALAAGFADYFTKPFDLAALIHAIDRIVPVAATFQSAV